MKDSDREAKRSGGQTPLVTGCECSGHGYAVFNCGRPPEVELQGIDSCFCLRARSGKTDFAVVIGDDDAAVLFVRDLEHGDPYAMRCARDLVGDTEESAEVSDMRSEARIMLRESESRDALDTGDALELLRRLAGDVDPVEPDGDDPPPLVMTFDTFRKCKLRLPWSSAPEDAVQVFEEREQPKWLLEYPNGWWIAELESGVFELTLDRQDHTSTGALGLEFLEQLLHEWALVQGDLMEDDVPPMLPPVEVMTVPVMSTLNLSKDEAMRESGDWPTHCLQSEVSLLVYFGAVADLVNAIVQGDDRDESDWPGFLAAARWAERRGYQWLRFDTDADPQPGLKVFPW